MKIFFTNIAGGDYLVIVKDNNGTQASQWINVPIISPPVLDELNIDEASCGQNNGVINVIVSGVVPPLIYTALTVLILQNNNIFTDLSGGDYSISIKDANDCLLTQNINIPKSDSAYY